MVTRQSLGLVALISVLLLGGSANPALAKGNKHGKGQGPHKQKVTRVETVRVDRDVIVVDRDGHRRFFNEYYTREGLPPGLAKRRSLPPGLRRQLRERGHLPPGLQKRLEPVPLALGGRLPPVPPYYRRYFADRDLIVIDEHTNRIVAVIRDVRP
jgi:hypothetical protein